MVPACVRSWPAIIAAGWHGQASGGSVRSSRPLRAVATLDERQRWLGWVLTPRGWRDDIDRVARDAVELCGGRVVLNPEQAWKGAPEGEASALVAALRERGVGKVWCCSYAWPSSAPSFPWEEFSAACDGGIALTFDRRGERDSVEEERAFVARAVEQWRARGFVRVLVSVGTWRQDERRSKSADELRAELAVRQPARSVVWAPSWSQTVCRMLAAWAAGRALPEGASTGASSGGAIVAALALGLGLYLVTR